MKKRPELESYIWLDFKAQPYNQCEDRKHALKLVNAQRGFPEGFPEEKYKREEDCEKASPGIVRAQLDAEWAMRISLTARVYIDKDGHGRYEIVKPSGLDIKMVDK
jgi:hypothetical protein